MSAYAFALMAARMGLDRRAVVAAAVAIVDAEGVDALSMARLAGELGIRGPSLYAHVRNQAELRRDLWLWVLDDLGELLRASVMGRSGREALIAFATAMRDYAREHQARYLLTLQPPVPFDDEAVAASHRANSAFRAVIRSFGLEGDEAVHCGRALRAAVHGFVELEARNALARDGGDESWEFLLLLLVNGIESAREGAGALSRPA
jgi:AcrR family transcriptional regulator